MAELARHEAGDDEGTLLGDALGVVSIAAPALSRGMDDCRSASRGLGRSPELTDDGLTAGDRRITCPCTAPHQMDQTVALRLVLSRRRVHQAFASSCGDIAAGCPHS